MLFSKISGPENDARDGQWTHSDRSFDDQLFKPEHSAKTTNAKSPTSLFGMLPTQTMEQIVQKAALHLKNGQSEVQLQLKPEYLGQVRMQIITENQQVVIRIVAETPMVKEMLESQGQQLKHDLQQQGLKLDDLEVTVSQHSNPQEGKQARSNAARRRQIGSDPETQTADRSDTGISDPSAVTEVGIDGSIDFFA
jgi:flagellar hook-length control protein FliK